MRFYKHAIGLILVLGVMGLADHARAADDELTITQVRVEKLFYKLNTPASGSVTVHNPTGRSIRAVVQCVLKHDLEGEEILSSQRVKLSPGSEKTFVANWTTGSDTAGYAFEARVSVNRRVVASSSDYFAVATNYAKVGHSSGSPVASRGEEWNRYLLDDFVPSLRATYVNSCMRNAWGPDDFSELTPDGDAWVSGQGRYDETAKGIHDLIAACHKQGISIYTYSKAWASGPTGFDFARRHPKWVGWDKDGHYMGSYNVYDIALGKGYTRNSSDWHWLEMNLRDVDALNSLADEVSASVRQFNWDGVFFDSAFGYYGTHDYQGNNQWTKKFIDIDHTSNTRHAKNRMWKNSPGLVIGTNAYQGPRNTWLVGEYRELMTNTWVLYEKAGSALGSEWPFWRYFANAVGRSTRITHAAGGWQYVGYLKDGCRPYMRHAAAIILANNAHVMAKFHHGAPRTELVELLRLATRYAHVLYHEDVRFLPRHAYEAQVAASRELWWEDFIYERRYDDGSRDVMVHLVNSPNTEKASQKEQTAPPRATNVTVSIEVPAGMKVVGGWGLTPDLPLQSKLDLKVSNGRVTVQMPEFDYYAICVLRLRSDNARVVADPFDIPAEARNNPDPRTP